MKTVWPAFMALYGVTSPNELMKPALKSNIGGYYCYDYLSMPSYRMLVIGASVQLFHLIDIWLKIVSFVYLCQGYKKKSPILPSSALIKISMWSHHLVNQISFTSDGADFSICQSCYLIQLFKMYCMKWTTLAYQYNREFYDWYRANVEPTTAFISLSPSDAYMRR